MNNDAKVKQHFLKQVDTSGQCSWSPATSSRLSTISCFIHNQQSLKKENEDSAENSSNYHSENRHWF